MAKRNDATTKNRPVEPYDHKAKQRVNNPPVGLVVAKSDAAEGKKTYGYDPHLDPTLVWAGKTERTSFAIPTVSLHVHERIDEALIEAYRGTVSLPFAPGKHGRVAVEIVDDRGIESLKILEIG